MHTVSRKSERLVNLTIALLATKRFLTKSEIFRTLEGYEGSSETKERMFERDKDDLRALGIDIEVGSFDPLFEDEPGYRIKPENYEFQLKDLTPVDIGLLSIAASAWQGAALDTAAFSALLKLQSIGIDSDIDLLPALAPKFTHNSFDLELVIDAIAARNEITFSYRGPDMGLSERQVRPYGYANARGSWFIVGLDVHKQAIRTFKASRIVGNITAIKLSKGFDIPEDFSVDSHLVPQQENRQSVLRVRHGKAHSLRHISRKISSDGEWDTLLCDYSSDETFIQSILWHGLDVMVLEPLDLRDQVISCLKKLRKLHG